MSVLKTACVQISAGLDDAANLARLEAMIGEAVAGGARFVALPEYCGCYGMAEGRLEVGAVAEAEHASLKALRDRAAAHAIWLLIGSLGVRAPDGRIANRSFLVNPEGAVAARYDKIHLFDVDLAGGESYRESADVAPGDRAVLADLDGTGLGLSICYDLRFARLYRSLAKAGASILSVPAAFTRKTAACSATATA